MTAEEFLKNRRNIHDKTISDCERIMDFWEITEIMEEYHSEQLLLHNVSQQRELLAFVKEVAEWDKDYSSTNIKLKAKELLKANCG